MCVCMNVDSARQVRAPGGQPGIQGHDRKNMAGRSGSIDDPLDLDRRHVGSRRVDGLFDRVLESHRRRRAAVATPLHSQADNSVAHAQQFDVALVRAKVGPHLIERLPDADFEVERMKTVQQEQAAIRDRRPRATRSERARVRPSSAIRSSSFATAAPWKLEEGLHQLSGLWSRRGGIGEFARGPGSGPRGRLDRRLDFVVPSCGSCSRCACSPSETRHSSAVLVLRTSANARPSRPCRCQDTCERRTASRGRSCARPA